MSAGVTPEIVYPESDGKPVADNTKQLRWFLTLATALMGLFRHATDVFVGSDLLWYPLEGEPGMAQAPDIFVVFGRPPGDRRSYKQWEEAGLPMTVVFEILSHSNSPMEMMDKFAFYEENGVEEYYLFDPDANRLRIFIRGRETLRRIYKTDGFVSPRLGVKLVTSGPELAVFGPDGLRFLDPRAAAEEREALIHQRDRLVVLARRALAGQATPEEALELQRLLGDGEGGK